jgi:hypothetical protein
MARPARSWKASSATARQVVRDGHHGLDVTGEELAAVERPLDGQLPLDGHRPDGGHEVTAGHHLEGHRRELAEHGQAGDDGAEEPTGVEPTTRATPEATARAVRRIGASRTLPNGGHFLCGGCPAAPG